MKAYIAGPMSGIIDHNFPAFYECADFLYQEGINYINPAGITGVPDPLKPWEYYMKQDIEQMMTCDSIVLLEGWERSKGATTEYNLAKKLNMGIYTYDKKNKSIHVMDNTPVGLKFDEAKLRYDLVPVKEQEEIIKVLTFGAMKYADNNWQNVGNPKDTYYAAIQRHLAAWRQGELKDLETGLSHLAHAGCNILFLSWFDNQEQEE